MPLLQTQQLDTHTCLGIWVLEEQTEELLCALPDHVNKDTLSALASIKRQNEWLASRILAYNMLRQFTEEPLSLSRNEYGKPLFEGARYHISISHSANLAAVIISDKYNVGIDVEFISPKAQRIADKFLSETEKEYTAADMERTCLYWSAKETLYKIYSKKQLIFKDNLILTPTETAQNNMLQGCIQTDNFSKLYEIYFETVHDHILTYTIDR